MRKKNFLWMAIVIPILLSLATVFPMVAPGLAQASSHPAQALWVDVSAAEPVPYCNDVIVDIYVNVTAAGMNPGATGLYAWEFNLYWNSTLLNCTDATDHLPATNWNSPNNFMAGAGINQTFNATHGRYWRAVVALPVQSPYPTPFVGVMSLCTLTFHVKWEGALTVADLTLAKQYTIDANLGDDTGAPFTFTAYDNSLEVIPEFPMTLIMPLLSITTLVTVILGKTVLSMKRKSRIVVN